MTEYRAAIDMGERYTDSITGWSGVAVGITFWLFGCSRVALERKGKDGKPEQEWFDEQRLSVEAVAKVGGPPVRGMETG